MADDSWIAELYGGLGEAVTEIRETYEEAVWGRAVTEPHDWPQDSTPEVQPQQPVGLEGEVLPPEVAPMHTPESAGQLEHGYTIDAEAMQADASAGWPQ